MAKRSGKQKEYYQQQKFKTEKNLEKKLKRYVLKNPNDSQAVTALQVRSKSGKFSKK